MTNWYIYTAQDGKLGIRNERNKSIAKLENWPDAHANGCLIAESPTMLDLLERSFMALMGGPADDTDLINDIRESIEKVRGAA